MTGADQKFCIVGLGVTAVGKQPGRSVLLLEAEAARLAIEDAGLARADIDGALQMLSDVGGGVRNRHDDAFPRVLGLPVNIYMENIGRGGEYAAMAICMAQELLRLGICKYVVCSGARDDWSRSRQVQEEGRRGVPYNYREGNWGAPFGESAPFFHGMIATRHMEEFGTTSEQLGHIAVAQRAWACRNPAAAGYGRPITVEDHQNSPVVAWPYHLLDICVMSDGGTAFVMTTEERAKDLDCVPIYVEGIGFGEHLASMWWDKTNYTQLAVEKARDTAFAMAGIKLADIDVAQFYDCFTMEVMQQIEGYGWCGKGEGGPFVETEGAIGPGGKLAFNTGGGLLSSHHLGNLTCFAEAVMQLRGQGGERQVAGAEIALATGHGGEIVSGQMCSIHSTLILRRGS
jgi:acetyl-CoA acetyltransferase